MRKTELEMAADSPLAVRIAGAVKRYQGRAALAGLDLELGAGEWLGFLGANGAGKTSTMLAIAGLIDLDDGAIELFGRPVSGPMPDMVGWVPQEIALYSHLTARENLTAFGRLHGLSGSPLAEALRWALDWTGLRSRAEDRVGAYSGGMKRRLNIACGVLHRPRVLLLDEPTVGVDPQARERILTMLRELRSEGTALLQSTHEFGDVESSCDRLVILDQGRAIASGALEELVRDTVGAHVAVTMELDAPAPAELGGEGVQIDGATVQARIDDAEAELTRLLQRVHEVGRAVMHLEVRRAGLMEVFLTLTGKDLRE